VWFLITSRTIYQAQRIRARATTTKRDTVGTTVFDEAPNAVGTGVCGGGLDAVAFDEILPPLGEVFVTSVQFAQVMRVVFAKWRVRAPLPKKDFELTSVEA
jgi:hypothetical protein